MSETKPEISLAEAVARFVAQEGYKNQTVKGNDGKRYKFRGCSMATYSTRWKAGREQNRWDEYELFALEDGEILQAYEYVTQWQGEQNEYGLKKFPDLTAVLQTAPQDLLDNLRKTLCDEFAVAIPLSEIAQPLSTYQENE